MGGERSDLGEYYRSLSQHFLFVLCKALCEYERENVLGRVIGKFCCGNNVTKSSRNTHDCADRHSDGANYPECVMVNRLRSDELRRVSCRQARRKLLGYECVIRWTGMFEFL